MPDLAPIYLDDSRVKLQGDPKPRVSAIVAAGGKKAGQVVRLRSPTDERGEPVQLEAVIDRANESGPVYLRVVEAEASLGEDESSGLGSQQQFGAARTGTAGQGATGEKEGSGSGALALDKQAKSDFTRPERPERPRAQRDPDQRNGASNQTYGAGDLAPGGRTGLTEEADRAEGHARQAAWRGDPGDARTKSYEDGHSSLLPRGKRPSRSREGDGSAPPADAD